MARKLAILLMSVVVPPALTLAWLGARLLQQDRAMIAQRETERQQEIAQSKIDGDFRNISHLGSTRGAIKCPPPGSAPRMEVWKMENFLPN